MKLIKNIKPEFTDERGNITMLLDDGKTSIRSTLFITSKKGAVRGNHYRKEDSHYCYMLSGKMEYFEKPAHTDDSKIEKIIAETGDLVYSPPGTIHAMRFLEDSSWVVLSTKSRKDGAYEEDTVRIKII